MSRLRWIVWLILLVVVLVACGGGAEEAIVVPTPVQQPATAVPTAETDIAEIPTPLPEPTATSENPTAVPTPTLAPTATPAATATAVSLTSPELQSVTADSLPELEQGVVFIADGALKRWGQGSVGIETLLPGGAPVEPRQSQRDVAVGDITQYAMNSDGTRLVAARLTDAIEQNNPDTYTHELIWLDVVSGESRQIGLGLDGFVSVGVSDDGRYVAYSAKRPSSPNSELYSVHLLNAEEGGLPQVLGECSTGCGNFVWHPDHSNVVWSDLDAIWIFNIAGREPRKLLENQQGDPEEIRIYSPISWARNGRYLLMWQGGYEGGQRAVLDVPTGQIMVLPDSFVYAAPAFAEVTWMQDNRLLVMRPNASEMFESPTIELWRVQEAQGELVLEESSELTAIKGFPVAPIHLSDGRFAFALENDQDSDMSGFYILTALGDTLERSNGILPATAVWDIEAVWEPSGSGAIASDVMGRTIYAPAGGGALYDITEAVGTWANRFSWLPPRTES